MSQEDAIKKLGEAEVVELDDQSLEDVAGGREMFEGDNNENCGCGGEPDSGGSGNTNCGCA